MNTNTKTHTLAQSALIAALCYLGFQFLRIDIPIGAGKTAFHFGNVFMVLGSLLLGGPLGGLSAAVGMGLADLTSGYAMYFPQTFIMKFCIGLIIGTVAHKIGHLSQREDKLLKWSLISGISGMVFNILVDPLVGYVYHVYLLKVDKSFGDVLLKYSQLTTFVNAILAVIVSTILYLMIRPILKKSNLFPII